MLPIQLSRKSNPDNWTTAVHARRLPGIKRANMEFPIPEFPISGDPNGRRRARSGAPIGASLDFPIVAGLRGALVVE